jgi:hypothetical protein
LSLAWHYFTLLCFHRWQAERAMTLFAFAVA